MMTVFQNILRGAKAEAVDVLRPSLESYTESFPAHSIGQDQ